MNRDFSSDDRSPSISGKWDAEAELRRLMLDSVEEGIHGLDGNRHIFYENELSRRILGWEEGELTGKSGHSLIHHHRADGSEYAVQDCPIYKTLHDGQSRKVQNEIFFRRDGSSFPVEYVCSCVRNPAGEIAGVMICFRDVTEEKRVEEAARAQASLLEHAQRIAGMGSWSIDLETGKTTWTETTCALFGITLAEFRGTFEHFSSFVVSDDVKNYPVKPENPFFEVEYRIRRPDGKVRWMCERGHAEFDPKGREVRRAGMVMDITDRKQMIRALKMLHICNKELLHAATEAELLRSICELAVETGGYSVAWVGFALDDATKSILPVAHAGDERGYLREIFLSWSEDHPGGKGPGGKAIRLGRGVLCENLAEDKDFFWKRECATRGFKSAICLPLRGPDRSFGVLSLYSGDLNSPGQEEMELLEELADNLAFGIDHIRAKIERERLEASIREQASLLDHAQEAIFVTDLQNRVTYWNKSAERLFGWASREIKGQSVRALLHKSELSPYDKAKETLLTSGEWSGELIVEGKDGHKLNVEARWTLVKDDHGKPKSVFAINTDITEKKRLEAQYMRVQRLESIGTLAGGIAHDLNNVLAPVLLSIEMLQEKVTDKDCQGLLATMKASTKHGADLVKQVLGFARGVEVQRARVDLRQIIRDIQQIVRDTFPKNIFFETEIGKDSLDVTGDATQLHQVFLNLCLNARDAMPEGGRIKISLERTVLNHAYSKLSADVPEGAYVVALVSDTGPGIPMEVRDKIFDPFFTTKEVGKGTGLGLSQSLGIVKSHGGFINLNSNPGRGTVFQVYLPALMEGPIVPTDPQLPKDLRGNNQLILLVDDEEAIRKVAQLILQRFGYRVITATNGVEGIAQYVNHQDEIAGVLTDMAMPIIDGKAMIAALKAINPQVRIVGSSGVVGTGDVDGATLTGATRFITKPYSTDALLQTLHQVLTEK